MSHFSLTKLTLGVTTALTASLSFAAGMDRSGQDVTAFLQDGTYAEAVYTHIDANVTGKDTAGKDTGDIAEAYDFFRYGVKADINDTFSVGVLYDEPFGAAIQYDGTSNFVADKNATATIFAQAINQATKAQLNDSFTYRRVIKPVLDSVKSPQRALAVASTLETNSAQAKPIADRLRAAAAHAEATDGQKTNVEIRTNNLTMLVGAKLGANKNFQIYGGPVAQRVKGEVHLRGPAYQVMTGYDAKIATDTQLGWAAGLAFYKPEIALKAALTYRSEIDHKSSISETVPVVNKQTHRDFGVTLPNSWNLDFQTGVNPTTLLTAKVRYVPWSNFDIRPPTYGETTTQRDGGNKPALPIISYDKDQWSAEVGLGKRVTDRLAVSGAVGWDSGTGSSASSLGPVNGYYSVGGGVKYNFTPEWALSVGGKYLKFGDATAELPNGRGVGEFKDNDGYAVGVKLAYQGK